MRALTFRIQARETPLVMAPNETPPLARNAPPKILDSWKQIASYLKRSERTVRRWEAAEGLPVHRRGHHFQDTVFAYRHELDAWASSRTRCPRHHVSLGSTAPNSAGNEYLAEHDAITRTMHRYVAGARAGDSSLMRSSFHSDATISGFVWELTTAGRSSTFSSGSTRTAQLQTLSRVLRE